MPKAAQGNFLLDHATVCLLEQTVFPANPRIGLYSSGQVFYTLAMSKKDPGKWRGRLGLGKKEQEQGKAGGLIPLAIAFLGAWICVELIKSAAGLPIDDAYIFKRYALNLASGFGFSFNPGSPSFGCSSFLWALLLAALVKIFGPNHYSAIAQWAGIIFTCLAVWYLLKLVRLYTKSFWLMLLAGFLAWLSATTFMNAVSGMESGLFSCLVMLTLYRFAKMEDRDSLNGLLVGLSSGLAFLTRPEALFFPITISLICIYQLLRGNKSAALRLFTYAIGFGAFALPFLVWLKSRFHQFLPFTYLAKIFSADPEILQRPLTRQFTDGIGSFLEGSGALLGGLKLIGWAIAALALISLLYVLIKFIWNPKKGATVLIAGWMLLPFAYGFSFPVSPHFGGYYQRYIASLYLVLILLSLAAFGKIFNKIPGKGLIYAIALLLALGYGHPIVIGQFKAGKAAYIKEAGLNQGIRLEAANWLKEKTPEPSKILIGHTGLGVVGGECGRYVYDLGGLINRDLLPYLEGSKPMTKKRWEKILNYICDKEIDYYASFAPMIGPDPAQSPGFSEQTRIGVPGEPASPYQQIRIYRINRSVFCPEKGK